MEHKVSFSSIKGNIQKRCWKLLIQFCDAEGINILKGVVSKDHIHIEYRPSQDVSSIVKKLKGRSSRKLQQELPQLHKR